MNRRRLVRVPASSANLGPGFDVLAAALSIHLELEVPEDRTNLIVRAFERLHPADGFEFRIRSGIPMTGGLGTSAAATLAGLLAADHMFELDADVFALACEMEGHPDNVAAALHGGFVVTAGATTARFEVPPGLEAILVVPGEAVRTSEARAALPAEVPMADAVFNVARASLLTLALAQGRWELFAEGLRDRLHQPHRAHLYPRSCDLVDEVRDMGALGATISGAGPAVLVWTQYDLTAAVLPKLKAECEDWAEVMHVPFETQGADVRAL